MHLMCILHTVESWSYTEVYYIHRCDGNAFLNFILLLIFLTFDFTWRWLMAETNCDYENKNLIYDKIIVMVWVLFSSFCCWRCPCFWKIHRKWRRTLFRMHFDHTAKYFALWTMKKCTKLLICGLWIDNHLALLNLREVWVGIINLQLGTKWGLHSSGMFVAKVVVFSSCFSSKLCCT